MGILRHKPTLYKSCFVISPIGEKNSKVREKADKLLDLLIYPILFGLGYEIERADMSKSPGLISKDIVKKIFYSDLVIADVSDNNPNVFYELAIRNSIKKPVIILKKNKQKLPFDIQDKRAISVERNSQGWKEARLNLKDQIIEAENHPQIASESILFDFNFNINFDESMQKTMIKNRLWEQRFQYFASRTITSVKLIKSRSKRINLLISKYYDKELQFSSFKSQAEIHIEIVEKESNKLLQTWNNYKDVSPFRVNHDLQGILNHCTGVKRLLNQDTFTGIGKVGIGGFSFEAYCKQIIHFCNLILKNYKSLKNE